MSWRDRDWARFSEEERQLFYGSVSAPRSCPPPSPRGWSRLLVWGLLGAAVIAVSAMASVARFRSDASQVINVPTPGGQLDSPYPGQPPVVYSGQDAYGKGLGGRLACTAEVVNTRLRAWVCTMWQIVKRGQVTRPAIDPGGPCGVRHVDQVLGRLVCDSVVPPDPNSVPPVRPLPTPATPDPRV